MSHTFSPEADHRAEALAALATLAAAVLAILVFFPAEGLVLFPVHAGLDRLLGNAVFVLPLGCALAGALAFVRREWPSLALPKRRLLGLGLITIGVLPAEELLGRSTGLIGEWFTGFLLELLGAPFTIAFTTAVMIVGVVLAFEIRHWRRRVAAR